MLPNAPSADDGSISWTFHALPSALGRDSMTTAGACEYSEPPETALCPASQASV
jgi:hypothetical protein